jgi:UDP-glucose 4-epimerase
MQHSTNMKRTVLVTGGAGFLGRAVAREYAQRGWNVIGIGLSSWTGDEAHMSGFSTWHSANVDLVGLSRITTLVDVVVHCAGNGSVPYSQAYPSEAYCRTVHTTAAVLEFCRSLPRPPMIVYPSSAAVYGAAPDEALSESSPSNPVSPYGYHKRMTEDLLASYARHGGPRAAIIRFFSIYGPGLDKQLLWDASKKLTAGEPSVTFWGTGGETRDWIHVSDAARLVVAAAQLDDSFTVLNGGSGQRSTVLDSLALLREHLGSTSGIEFNGEMRSGDPRHYLADMTRAHAIGWLPKVSLNEGFQEYAKWFKAIQ